MATSAHRRLTRRLLGILASLFLATFVVAGLPGTAQAADGYRYWNYFHLDNGSWAFSKVGAGEFVPEDGSVEGYRYGTSATAAGIPPRADLAEVSFEAVCADEEASADQKRVAVLIDYGTDADAEGATPPAPRGACAVVPNDATGQQVLETTAEVRAEGGLTCAIDGYPVQGCGVSVKNAKDPQEQNVAFELPASAEADADAASAETAEESDTGLVWPLVGVGLVVVVIAAATVGLNRRNKSA